jgi:signal transduction histidine kinase
VQRAQIAKNELDLNRKNNLLYGSIALAFVLGLGGYLFYSQQRLRNRQLQKEAALKTALVKIEAQNSLQQQRLRISRDLHDNIGSQLTFIISSIDTLNYGIKNGEVKIKDQLGQLAFFAKKTINELRDTIWAMNKEAITFEDLQYRINLFIANANTSSNVVGFEFIVDSDIDLSYSFTASEGINVYRIIQEAVTNSLKYAFPSGQNTAQLISVHIYKSLHFFHLQITDNGSGFDMGSIEMGNGIKNMRKRAADLNSELELHSEEQKGTSIKLKIPVRHGKED